MTKLALSILLVLLLPLSATQAGQENPDPATEAIFKRLMTATIAADYDAFTADCDATMKAAITREKLEAVSKQVGPRLKPGYESQYLGGLKQQGFAVLLWKVRCSDQGDDFLATVSIKGDKVGGFYLH